jgi:hypothetical protein
LTITPKFRLDAVLDQDNDALLMMTPTTTWEAFVEVSFDYFVTEDSVYENTPHVNIALRDPITMEAKCAIVFNEKGATKGEWETVTFDKDDPYSILFGAIVGTDVFNCFTIEVADGPGVITAEQVQTVWVKNPKLGDTIMYWFRVPNSSYGNVPPRTVHFVMGYDFAFNAAAGVRTVETVVTYRGTYTQGFVWTP